VGFNLVVIAAATAGIWLLFAFRFPQHATWLLLLWIPVQGWFQLNVFGNSSAAVLLYELQAIGLYLVFAARALRSPEHFGPPPFLRFAVPFAVWVLLLVPQSVSANGWLSTLLGIRADLLPIPLLWIGYHAFRTRRQLENVSALLMLQMVPIATVAASQLLRVSSASGAIFEVPTGYVYAGVLRPPGTFSFAGHFGIYVLFAILFALGLLGMQVTFWRRTCFAAGLMGAIVGLIVNTQRSSIVLLVLAVPLTVILARRPQDIIRIAVAFFVILAGGVIGSQLAGEAFSQRVETIRMDLNMTVIENPIARMTDALRMPVWGGGLGIAAPGAVHLLAEPAMGWAPEQEPRGSIKPAESFMAALVYQTGVPGLILFYTLIAAVMYRSRQALRACRATDCSLLAAAIFSYQVAILLLSWAYDPLHYLPSRVLFWVWSGVLLALPKLATRAVVPERPVLPRPIVATRRLARPVPMRTVAASRQRP
jgi:hypothetical protein